MATASKVINERDKQKLAELKKEIGELLADEGGKIDASSFKDKYKEYFRKTFKLPKDAATMKLTVFFQKHMSNSVEISKEGCVNFIEAKSKSKETAAVKRNATENEKHDMPATTAVVGWSLKQNFHYQSKTSSVFERMQQKPGPVANVKAAVEHIIEELSKEHFVDVDIVKKRLFQRFKVRNAGELGYRRDDEIPGLKDLIRKQREVNASIQAFVLIRSVSTLYELGQYLTNLYSEARDFGDLHVGPLVRHPLVYKYFKFPPNQEPPDITTLKVMKYLKQFMNQRKLWASKVDMQEFLEYLTEQMSCTSPYELGVRIESIALMISVIKRCSSAESTIRKEAEKRINEEIADEIEQYLQQMKKRLLGSRLGGPDTDALVSKLHDLSPIEILTKLFEYCMQFFQGKVKKKVETFIETCVSDKTCRKLFQLALHKACRELVKPVEDFSSHPTGYGACIDDVTSGEETSVEESSMTPSPPEGELLHEVKRWLAGNSSTSMNIKLLARVEEHILDGYRGFQAFKDLGHGSFLQFLSRHKELQALVSLSSSVAEGALGSVQKADVLDLIQQCGFNTDKAKILKTLQAQYRPDGAFDSTSLGVLVEHARQQGGDSNCVASRGIIYEACLVTEMLESPQAETNAGEKTKNLSHVGFLGYQDVEKVLQCLYQTPLLEDYAVWSNWDHVFAPMYGNLKKFLKKVDRAKTDVSSTFYPDDLVAMETSTGCLVRVTRCTSVEHFLKSAKHADIIGTSGHLVSLVLDHGGVEKAPLALLANHMKEALLSLSSSTKSPTAGDVDEYVVRFAISCLSRIPSLMRRALAMQVFVEPLKHVFGHTAVPGLVLKNCGTQEERSMIHNLGICLGITEWQEDFKKKLVRSSGEVETLERTKRANVIDEEQGTAVEPNEPQDNQKEHSKAAYTEVVISKTRTNVGKEKEEDDPAASPESVDLELDLTEREQHCRIVIDSIRREQFGVGMELPPEHRQMVENQRLREGRGLHRLSSELYSKDTHFVLELVQNADDNRYPDETSPEDPPSIAFFVNIDKVVVFNNEVGFEEKNIRALCDVGKSTKGKQRYGYIGQKGIGFKSVFRITDTPEVHSNGYHVKFDAKSGPTGYILPHWCEPSDEEGSILNLNWTTRIVLILKDEMKTAQRKTLIARFHDIQPSLLLFLRRLRQIIIKDEVSDTSREMCRRDLGENLIELKHSNGVDHWFVVKRELAASSMKPDIETTEIALAFPLPTANSDFSVSLQDVSVNIRRKSLIQQPVFAFLPLRSYGFRFIVQGDFDVPSSREDVDKDSAWNQWLRQEIASLFVQAFDDFKNHPCFEALASVVQFLQFIPLEDEILDFFKPVTRTIVDGIRRKQCIPVRGKMSPNDLILDSIAEMQHPAGVDETGESSAQVPELINKDNLPGNELKWAFPSQVVVAEDPLIEELISDKVLTRYLRKFYLHPDLEPFLNPPLRQALGIETLSCRHLIDIGKAISSKVPATLEQEQSEANLTLENLSRWVAKWLCGVFRCLERERDCSEETLQEIASLNLYPLSDGQCTKLSSQPVFLPLEQTVKGEQTATKAAQKAANIVHKDLRSLHPVMLTSLDDIGRSQVRKLLERLLVRCLTSRDMIKHHIIPSLRSNQKQLVKDPEVLRSYVVYIKEQWDSDPAICDMEELRECALLQTNKGFLNPNTQPVHFTDKYGNETNLVKDFPSVKWTVLDNTYLAGSSKSHSSWEKFFSKLGVVHFLAVERKDVYLSKSDLSRSVWSSLYEFWPQPTGGGFYTIKDYASSELEKLLSPDSSVEELKKLAEILDQKWDDKYAKYGKEVPYIDEEGKVVGHTYSSFFLNLKEKSWIPSKYGTSSPKLDRRLPRDVFLADKDVVCLLGDHAYYAEPCLTNQKFLAALEIQTSVEFGTMVKLLMKWVEESQSADDQENSFKTSIEHMSNVYLFMERHIRDNAERQKSLENITKNKPIVFVPKEFKDTVQCEMRDSAVGQFVAKKRVYWFDSSCKMQKPSLLPFLSTVAQPRRMLKNYYPGLWNFFVNFLEVDESPNLKEYVGLMEAIASQSSMASGPIVDDMMRVYHVVGDKCLKENEDSSNRNCRFIKSQLLHLKVFPTLEDKWVSLEEKPLFSDDKSLEKLFREYHGKSMKKDGDTETVEAREKVHFVKMGLQKVKLKDREEQRRIEAENTRVRKNVRVFFAKACGIRNLSDCVSLEIISTQTSECVPLQLILHQWVPCIQIYLYHKRPDHHEKLQDIGTMEAVATVKCFGAKELEVVYRLSTHPSVNISIKKACGIQKNEQLAVYVTDSSLNDTSDLIKELARYFVPPEYVVELSNFLRLLKQTPDDQVENFLEAQDLCALPDDVPVWWVPEPEIVYVPLPEPAEDPVPETGDGASPETARDRHHVVNEIDGETRGLQSWPPKSSAISSNEVTGKNPSTEQALSMWPPPAPPEACIVNKEKSMVIDQVQEKPDTQMQSDPHLRTSPSSDDDPSPNPVQQSYPKVVLVSEEGPPNLGMAVTQVSNTDPRPPRASPNDVMPQRNPLPRPLVVSDGEVLVELEEIQLGSSTEPTELMTLTSSANAEEIGRWGEFCVYKLLQRMSEGKQNLEVIWVNENHESGLPYDIIMKEEAAEIAFIEVKSTSSPEKSVLEISSQEIQFSFQVKERYHLYRVYGAGNPSGFRVSRLCNLATNLDNKAVKLFILI